MTTQELQQLSDFLNAVPQKILDDTELLVMYSHVNNTVKSELKNRESI